MFDVALQVRHVLESDRHANQAWGDAVCGELLGWDVGVGHRHRVFDQGLGAAERHGEAADLEGIEDPVGGLPTATDVERDQRAGAWKVLVRNTGGLTAPSESAGS